MKTEVILHRDFHGSPVRQLSKSGYLNATDITAFYNEHFRIAEGKSPKQMTNYFEQKQTKEFIDALCNELDSLKKTKHGYSKDSSNELDSLEKTRVLPVDLKMVKRGKHNAGTWLHPYLFVDYAMWLSPEFRAKVVVWIGDMLLHYRNSSGQAYKECNKALNRAFSIGNKYWEYAKVAKFTAERVLGSDDPDQWNYASQEMLFARDKLIHKIECAANFGSFKSVDELLLAV